MSYWKDIRYFKPTENFGVISPVLVKILDAYRHTLGVPIYVSRGTEPPGTHDFEDSAHYPDPQQNGWGYAVDVFPLIHSSRVTLLDCFLLAVKYPFSGIGIYPYKKYLRHAGERNILERGMLHLDVSPHRRFNELQSLGYWIGTREKGGPAYEEISHNTLCKHRIV